MQGLLDVGFAVTTIRGDCAWNAPGALCDALDRRNQHRRVCRVASLDVLVEDHAVFVVDQLRLVTELDGLAEPALRDRAGIGIM